MKKTLTIATIFAILLVSVIDRLYSAQEYIRNNQDFTVSSGKTLEAVINIDCARLFIEKGRISGEGHVYAYYDTEKFNYDYFYDKKFNELFVSLESERSLRGLTNEDNFDKSSELIIELPGEISTNLDISIRVGRMDLDMTGVPLKNFSVKSWVSEADIRFDELNPLSLEYMKIDINIGDVNIENLGNANFRDATIDGGIGRLTVDLNGDYSKGDHYVTIDMDVGEVEIIPPRDIEYRIRISKWPLLSHSRVNRYLRKKGAYYYTSDFDDAETRITIKVDIGIGSCVVR